jgi:hypothetical protein
MEEFRIVHRSFIPASVLIPGVKAHMDMAIWQGYRLPFDTDWNEAGATSALMHVEDNTFSAETGTINGDMVLQKRKIAAKLGNLSLFPYSKWRDVQKNA